MRKEYGRASSSDHLAMVLTTADIAEILGISKNTAYELVHSKDFPAFRVGKQYRISKVKFLSWLDGDDAA